MELEFTSDEEREEQTEIFTEMKTDIESNDELSDNEKVRQIKQLELEYTQIQERWRAEDLQQEHQEEEYLTRNQSFFHD